MKHLLIIFFALLTANRSHSQEPDNKETDTPSFSESKLIKGDFSLMDVDILGNVFVITRSGRLIKYNVSGDSVAVWNDVKNYGNPGFLDVSNPMRILIYYPSYASVVMLDRLLTYRNAINLRKKSIFSTSALITSYDNNIWIFDQQNYKLRKLDEEGNALTETTDWRILFPESVPTPQILIDHKNKVFCFDTNNGLYTFDYYGSFINRKSEFKQILFPGINGNLLYGVKENYLLVAAIDNTAADKKIRIANSIAQSAYIKFVGDRLYTLSNQGVKIWIRKTE